MRERTLNAYCSQVVPIHGVPPGDGVAQTFVQGPTDVESLLGIECNALGHSFKVVAELAQHVAWGVVLVHQPQVVESTSPRGCVSVGIGGGGRTVLVWCVCGDGRGKTASVVCLWRWEGENCASVVCLWRWEGENC